MCETSEGNCTKCTTRQSVDDWHRTTMHRQSTATRLWFRLHFFAVKERPILKWFVRITTILRLANDFQTVDKTHDERNLIIIFYRLMNAHTFTSFRMSTGWVFLYFFAALLLSSNSLSSVGGRYFACAISKPATFVCSATHSIERNRRKTAIFSAFSYHPFDLSTIVSFVRVFWCRAHVIHTVGWCVYHRQRCVVISLLFFQRLEFSWSRTLLASGRFVESVLFLLTQTSCVRFNWCI